MKIGKFNIRLGAPEEAKLPIGYVIEAKSQLYDIPVTDNKYRWAQHIWQNDAEVYAAISKMSKLVQASYQGVVLHAGATLEESEKEVLEAAKQLAKDLDFESLFQAIARNLQKFGDDIYVKERVGKKVAKLKPLPIEFVTIVEDLDQINQFDAQIFEKNYYVLCEGNSNQQYWSKDDVVHFSLDPVAEPVFDIKGRYTFGVWSICPLERLKPMILWKWNTILTDVLWKNRNVPREHHKLDLSMFSPDYFTGTPEQKMQKAQSSAETVIKQYADKIKHKMADQGFITDKSTEIVYVEPKTTRYSDTNELVIQQNECIFGALGITESFARGTSRGSYASEIALNSLNVVTAHNIANVIKRGLLGVLKENLLADGFSKEDVEKIDIKIQLIMPLERGELIRQIAVLTATGLFTPSELRSLLGFDPLTDEQKREIAESIFIRHGREGHFAQTVSDIARDYARGRPEEIAHPITPESRRDKQFT